MRAACLFALLVCTQASAQGSSTRTLVTYVQDSVPYLVFFDDGTSTYTTHAVTGIGDVRAAEGALSGDAVYLAVQTSSDTTVLYRTPFVDGEVGTPASVLTHTGQPRDLLFLDDGTLLLATHDEIARIDLFTGTVTSVRSVPSGYAFSDLALCAGGYAALARNGNVARIERFSLANELDSVVIEHTLPHPPTSFDADGSDSFVVSTGSEDGTFYTLTVGGYATSYAAAGAAVDRTRKRGGRLHYATAAFYRWIDVGPSTSESCELGGPIVDIAFMPVGSFATYGSACAGTTSAAPSIGTGGRLAVGNELFRVTVQDVPASALAVLLVGSEATQSSPLPPGDCSLLTSPLVLYPVTADTSGRALQGLSLPGSSVTLRLQWVVLDGTSVLAASAGAVITTG